MRRGYYGDRSEDRVYRRRWHHDRGLGARNRGDAHAKCKCSSSCRLSALSRFLKSSLTEAAAQVVVRNISLENNHRQGMSVISAVGLLVEDTVFRGTNGTAPEAGVDIEPDNPKSTLVDVVFRRCHAIDNNGCGFQMNLYKLEHAFDAPMSILFEDCHAAWSVGYPFESPFANRHNVREAEGSGYLVGGPRAAGSVTVRGGTVRGSAGAGIDIENKRESGPTITFADVTLINVARVDDGFSQPWMRAAPILLLTEEGGLGGIWFESVRVIDDRPRPFLRWEQLPCKQQGPCGNGSADIRGDIAVEWLSTDRQCMPSLLDNGSAWVGPGPLRNLSIACDQHNASEVLGMDGVSLRGSSQRTSRAPPIKIDERSATALNWSHFAHFSWRARVTGISDKRPIPNTTWFVIAGNTTGANGSAWTSPMTFNNVSIARAAGAHTNMVLLAGKGSYDAVAADTFDFLSFAFVQGVIHQT